MFTKKLFNAVNVNELDDVNMLRCSIHPHSYGLLCFIRPGHIRSALMSMPCRFLHLSPFSKWAYLNCGEDEKMVLLIVNEMICTLNIIYDIN